MESHCIRPSQLEPHQIVDDELMERLQQERCAPQRRPVQFLTLLVAKCLLNDPDTELRGFRVHLILWVFQVSKESLYRLLQFLTGDLPSIPYTFGVL